MCALFRSNSLKFVVSEETLSFSSQINPFGCRSKNFVISDETLHHYFDNNPGITPTHDIIRTLPDDPGTLVAGSIAEP